MLIFYLSFIDDPSERKSFEEMYLKYHRTVFAYALRIMENHHDAEDAAQNTWLWISQNMKLFHTFEEAALGNYIMKIVYTKCMDILRKEKKELSFDEESEAVQETLAEEEDSLLFRLCLKEDYQMIAECLKLLEPNFRDVLNLYYFNGNSTKEIAKILGLNRNTVKQRLSRGRQKLIKLLQMRGLVYES